MIKNFTIYGERCSGTNFLQRCFSKYTGLHITWEFGWKHFFGYNDHNIISRGDNTLFLCIVRNPYQWLMSFDRRRHHIKEGKKKTNFFTGEWQSVRKDKPGSPEIMEDRNPINGERYKNIFELRKYKCRYLWYELPLYAKNNYFIRYEDLLENNLLVLNHIVNTFNLSIKDTNIESAVLGKKHLMTEENFCLFNKELDWQTENTIGYEKLDSLPT